MGANFGKSAGKKCNQCTGHCCYNECFNIHEEIFKNALLNELKKYKIDYTLNIIIELIGKLEHIMPISLPKNNPNYGYKIYTHSVVSQIYLKNKCPENDLNIADLSSSTAEQMIPNSNQSIQEYNIVVLGLCGVGKSALIIRFITDNFLEEYDPTICDSYRRIVNIGNRKVLFDILDTASREEFCTMEDQWIREGHIFFLCFALNDKRSWNELMNKRDRIVMSKENEYAPIILVGTKGDLKYENEINIDSDTFVDQQEIINKANEWGVPFIETSAKRRKNIDLLFKYSVTETTIKYKTECHEK